MREFQERNRAKKFLHSRYAILLLLILCLILGRGLWGIYKKYDKSREIADKLQNELVALEEKQAKLNKAIGDLDTPEGKEREVRDRFGVVKAGEKMVVLVDESPVPKQQGSAFEESWWAKFWGFFGL